MNNKYENVIQQMEALLSISIKMSDRQCLDQVLFSLPRAKMLLSEIKTLRKQNIKVLSKHMKKEPAWLDNPC